MWQLFFENSEILIFEIMEVEGYSRGWIHLMGRSRAVACVHCLRHVLSLGRAMRRCVEHDAHDLGRCERIALEDEVEILVSLGRASYVPPGEYLEVLAEYSEDVEGYLESDESYLRVLGLEGAL